MTREEWLEGLAVRLRNDRQLLYVTVYGTAPKFLSSFPSRAARRVVLGDFARQTDGSRLALVSPLISSSLEVGIVAYWLLVRHGYRIWEARSLTNRGNSGIMAGAGFNTPFNQCVPTERLIDLIQVNVTAHVEAWGEYPAADVNLTQRRTQSTRLLKVMCDLIHDPYILRMSAAQYDRGAPFCGICRQPMWLA